MQSAETCRFSTTPRVAQIRVKLRPICKKGCCIRANLIFRMPATLRRDQVSSVTPADSDASRAKNRSQASIPAKVRISGYCVPLRVIAQWPIRRGAGQSTDFVEPGSADRHKLPNLSARGFEPRDRFALGASLRASGPICARRVTRRITRRLAPCPRPLRGHRRPPRIRTRRLRSCTPVH